MPRRVLTDSEKADLGRLIAAHQGRLRAFLCRFERDPDVVDELVQDVFVGVLDRCGELASRTEEDAGAYLRGVARNMVRLRWRKARQEADSRRKSERTVKAALRARMQGKLDGEIDDSDARLVALRACVGKLGGRARELVERHFFQKVPLAELARQGGGSGAALRMAMLRVRQQLKLCVESQMRGSRS